MLGDCVELFEDALELLDGVAGEVPRTIAPLGSTCTVVEPASEVELVETSFEFTLAELEFPPALVELVLILPPLITPLEELLPKPPEDDDDVSILEDVLL